MGEPFGWRHGGVGALLMPVVQSRAMRIAVVLHDFSGGGSERVAIRLANGWAAAGRSVTILCGTEAGPLRALVAGNVAVRGMTPPIVRGRRSRGRLGRAVGNIVRAAPCDVVVGPGNFHVPVLATLVRRLGQAAPVVVCKISNPIGRPEFGTLRRAWTVVKFRYRTRAFDALVAMSPVLATTACRMIGRSVDWAYEPTIDDDWSAPVRSGDGGDILCAGRLVAQKRFGLALEAFARLGPSFRLTILGEGMLRGVLERQATALGVAGRVRFMGHVADIGPWLARADVFLSTAAYEGYPAVLVEAVAAGVPVVTTACSAALGEILTDGLGRIVRGDADALADAVRAAASRGAGDEAARVALIARHRATGAAAAWLVILDRVVAERSACQ